MLIKVNGKELSLEQEISLLEFLISRQIDPRLAIIEHNEQILKNEDWANVIIKENDTLEVLRFIGGG
ncbi:MAG: sulfur carrier protein ThiS [Carboxydocellales bacterium]|jgi:sulfur carrier protein